MACSIDGDIVSFAISDQQHDLFKLAVDAPLLFARKLDGRVFQARRRHGWTGPAPKRPRSSRAASVASGCFHREVGIVNCRFKAHQQHH
jgi:hypothetical protein